MTYKEFNNLKQGDKIFYINNLKENKLYHWIVTKNKFNKTISGTSVICDKSTGATWTEITIINHESYDFLDVVKKKYAEYFI